MTNENQDLDDSIPRASRKGVFGWMMFDFAQQPFFTVVTTFIFGPYFVSRLADDAVQGQAAWGYTITIAGLIIALFSPVLGSIADVTGPRKPWIGFFAAIKILALFSLWWAEPGMGLFWPAVFMILATVAAEFSTMFNDSMIPRLIRPSDTGRISNIAWGLGYLGGLIVLIVVVAFLAGSLETGKTILGFAPLFGLDPVSGEDARIVGPMSALWYLVFLLPLFLFTPDIDKRAKVQNAIKTGLRDLGATFTELKKRTGLLKFYIAYMAYNDGVIALLSLGGAYAAALFGWVTIEIGIFGILLNLVAIPSCLVASRLDKKLSSKGIIIGAIIFLIIACTGMVSTSTDATAFGYLYFGEADSGGLFGTPAEKAYLAFGFFIGLAFGPIQASSRSYLAQSIDDEESGRFFGIYALTGRATSFLAPFIVASVTLAANSAALGMATILFFFVIGLALIMIVPQPHENRLKK